MSIPVQKRLPLRALARFGCLPQVRPLLRERSCSALHSLKATMVGLFYGRGLSLTFLKTIKSNITFYTTWQRWRLQKRQALHN
jgi:hypothetical protein